MQIRAIIAALIRLFALFLFLRLLEQMIKVCFILAQPAIMTYWWTVGLIVIIYAGLGLALFLLAPRIARLCVPEEPSGDAPAVPLPETLLFCCGFVVAVWGFAKMGEAWSVWTMNHIDSWPLVISNADLGPFLVPAVVFVSGIVFCSRVGSISRWLKSKTRGD